MEPKCDESYKETSSPPIWRVPVSLTPAQRAVQDGERRESGPSAQGALMRFMSSPSQVSRASTCDSKLLQDQQKSDQAMIQALKTDSDRQKRRSYVLDTLQSFMAPQRHHRSSIQNFEVLDLVRRTFPPRMQLPILVCDVGERSGSLTTSAKVGEIEKYWSQEKPPGVVLRWIHAPLGTGLVQSSIEDMFRHHQDPGKAFNNAGNAGFPYLEIDHLHFRDATQLQDMRDIYDLLKPRKDLDSTLCKDCLLGDKNRGFEGDLTWREDQTGKTRNYWDLAASDIPSELSEGFACTHAGPLRNDRLGLGRLDPSIIANTTRQFEGSHLVTAPIRFFHRADGILLSMSSASGVDLLHRDFQAHLHEDELLRRLTDPDACTVGHIMRSLQERGTQDWFNLTIEWFLIYIVTELGIAPHNMNSGRTATSLLSALQGTVKELKDHRYDQWQPGKAVKLVEEYLVCLDQLKSLTVAYNRKSAFFERLLKDVKEHETEENGNVDRHINSHAKGQSGRDRVLWASQVIRDDKSILDELRQDVTQSLEALFQLCSTEQNERAIITESQNKAVLIFTGVTVVFLPLSFFTSYYGMNLSDVRTTADTQISFWKVCGSVTLIIIALIAICTFRYQSLLRILGVYSSRSRGRTYRSRRVSPV